MIPEQFKQEEVDIGLKRLAKSSLIVLITLSLSKIFVYFYRVIVARHYGPEIYGLFALSIMLVGWFRTFSNLGLKQGLSRYIPLLRGEKEEERINYLFKKSFNILILTSIFAGILLFFFSEFIALKIFFNSHLIIFLKIFSITIPLSVLGEGLLSVLRAYEKIGWFSFISNILGNFFNLLILIILIFAGANSTSVPISYLLGLFFVLLVSYFVCKIKLPEIFNSNKKIDKSDKKLFSRMFSYSWPFIFQGIAAYVFYWIDSFMIGVFMTIEYVGFYNAATPIAMLLILPLTLLQLFFPLVTKEYSKGRIEIVRQLSQQVGKWVFMLTIPIFILFVIFPETFINIFFGQEYAIATNSLRFLSIGVLFSALFGVSQELLSMKGKSKLILIDLLCAALLNIMLNYFLVPKYGISGAGFATMLSLIVLNVVFFIQARKQLSIVPFRRKMLRVSLILIFSTISLLIIKNFVRINSISVIFLAICFLASYTILILTTGCLDKNDKNIINIIKERIKKN